MAAKKEAEKETAATQRTDPKLEERVAALEEKVQTLSAALGVRHPME